MSAGAAGSVVLLAESLDGHRHLLKRALEKHGCEVHAVQSARSAFETVESGIPVHLAVLDIPTTRHLLAELVLSIGKAKVVLVSSDMDELLAESMGCRYYQKPFSPTAFGDEINRRFLSNGATPSCAKTLIETARPVQTSSLVTIESAGARESILRLQQALLICSSCLDRCPGIGHCEKVAPVLRPRTQAA